VFRGRDAVAAGVLTKAELRGPLVQRLLRGVYAPAGTPVTHELCCRAAGLLAPRSAGLTGRSQATVLGVALARPEDPVEVVVPDADHFGPVQGLRVRRVCRSTFRCRPWQELRLADSARFCFDLCVNVPLPRAVAHLDAVARAGHLDLGEARRWFDEVRDNDVRHVREALRFADARAESPRESELRVLLHEAGIAVVPQHVVVDAAGRFVARVDLALVDARIAVEYDGAWHASSSQLHRDRDRLNRLREAGWTVVSVTAASLTDPGAVVDAVHRELYRAGAGGGTSRRGRAKPA